MSLLLLFAPSGAAPSASQFGLLPIMLSGTEEGGVALAGQTAVNATVAGDLTVGGVDSLDGQTAATATVVGDLAVGVALASRTDAVSTATSSLVVSGAGGESQFGLLPLMLSGTGAGSAVGATLLLIWHGVSGGPTGTILAELYEDGVLVHSFGEFEVTEETLLELPWTPELLELLSGENVELRLSGDVEIGAVAWRVATNTGPRFTTSGTLSLAGEPEALEGVIAAQTSASGALTLAYALQGSTAGETSVTAVFGIIIPLAGATSANTDASGVLARLVGLIAATAGVTEVSGVLFVAILSGQIHAETTVAGDLTMYYGPPLPPPVILTTARSGVRVGVRY